MSESLDDLKTPSLPSVPRAMEVLEHIADSQNGLSLTQLTRALGYPRSTLHCLLLTLERAGYIERASSGGRYQCGSKLVELSSKALAGSNLRQAASPVLRSLMQRLRLVTHLAVLERNQVTIIAQFAPPGERLMTTLGQRMEVHSTALGKAIAAYLDEARLNEIISGRVLPPHNERTIVSHRRFYDELAATQQRGYAFDDEEDTIGYRCLAAPILQTPQLPLAAISVMGTTLQISEENASSLAADLMAAATQVADILRTYADEGVARRQSRASAADGVAGRSRGSR